MKAAVLGMMMLGCGGAETLPDGGRSSGCPYEQADGVAAVRTTDAGGCSYVCLPVPASSVPRVLCSGDTACHVPNTSQHCNQCGSTCSGSTPYCVAGASGAAFYCSASATP